MVYLENDSECGKQGDLWQEVHMEADGLILAGGKSRRMGGVHKGGLMLHGQSLEERMIRELFQEAGTIWLSYGTQVRKEYPGCRWVLDEFPDCGPIGGLHAGLKRCESPLLMVCACDMPFLTIELFRYLYHSLMETEQGENMPYDGVVPVAFGRVHPLAALYRKGFSAVLEGQIIKGDYRLIHGLEAGRILYLDVTGKEGLTRMLTNVNTLAQYEAISQRPQVIAICGVKNSGKTTLLVRLIQALSRRGLKAAVIKHDGHDFTCDVPGTDSFRFMEAGAMGTAVYSRNRTFLHKLGEADEESLISQFPEVDVLFIEGMKKSRYPKLEVIRKEISREPASNPEGRFLIVTDWEPEHFSEPTAGLDHVEEIVERILEQMKI